MALLAVAGVFACLLPETAEAKKKSSRGRSRGRGGSRRGRGGRGRGRGGRGRVGFRRHTAKHTGVVKRMGEDTEWLEKRHDEIRKRHQAAMQAIRSSGVL